MKLLLDENVDRRLVPFLENLGHDVKVISVDFPHGLLDHEVLAIATREKRVLITQDRSDFGELIFRKQVPHAGILLFRMKSEEANIGLRKNRLAYVLDNYSDRLNQFLVITPKTVRVRQTPKTEREKAA